MQLVMYGRVGMFRDYCQQCERTALILDGKFACCDTPAILNQPVGSLKRECVTFDVRNLTRHQKDHILHRQDHCCFYCRKRFGFNYFYKGKLTKLNRHFDHIIPMAYQGDNSLPNVVAACAQCNLWKGSQIFTSIEECRLLLTTLWELNRDKPVAKGKQRIKVELYGVKKA